jgi:hypothetical protein
MTTPVALTIAMMAVILKGPPGSARDRKFAIDAYTFLNPSSNSMLSIQFQAPVRLSASGSVSSAVQLY